MALCKTTTNDRSLARSLVATPSNWNAVVRSFVRPLMILVPHRDGPVGTNWEETKVDTTSHGPWIQEGWARPLWLRPVDISMCVREYAAKFVPNVCMFNIERGESHIPFRGGATEESREQKKPPQRSFVRWTALIFS